MAGVTLPTASAIQTLFSLPTLRRVKIGVNFLEPSSFLQIWDGVPPSLIHLDLFCYQDSAGEVRRRPIPHQRSALMAPESLRLRALDYVRNWVLDDLSPLDFSRPKAFSVGRSYKELLRSPKLAPALRTIEVLDLLVDVCTSSYAWYRIVHAMPGTLPISSNSPPSPTSPAAVENALDILSALAAPSRVRTIMIQSRPRLSPDQCEKLDAVLVSLPVYTLPQVELEVARFYWPNTAKSFPRLASLNLLHVGDPDEHWFENFVGPPVVYIRNNELSRVYMEIHVVGAFALAGRLRASIMGVEELTICEHGIRRAS
ncbi:hypothetical protein FB451DRAFT_1363172 [Mycena latifolia]|nr:hypothetical protein FB451DRAFT_1363172 [Mycena latifolia]